MLNAFIYDFKKELRRKLCRQKLTARQIFVLAAVGLSMILYIAAAILMWLWLFIISTVLLVASLFAASSETTTGKKLAKHKFNNEISTICAQTQWFINKRVAIVKEMLDSNNTGLAPSKCIDLLLVECDNKLKTTRPSEITQKRIKPIVVPMTIIILSLITAWLNVMLPEMNISFEDSFSQHILSVMNVLASDIILSRILMVYFVAICVYATAIYFSIVFIIIPVVVSFVDQDFLLTAELKEVLLYIKHEESFARQEKNCE